MRVVATAAEKILVLFDTSIFAAMRSRDSLDGVQSSGVFFAFQTFIATPFDLFSCRSKAIIPSSEPGYTSFLLVSGTTGDEHKSSCDVETKPSEAV